MKKENEKMNFYRELSYEVGKIGAFYIVSGMCGGAVGGVLGFGLGYKRYFNDLIDKHEKSISNGAPLPEISNIKHSLFCIQGTLEGMAAGTIVGLAAPISIPYLFYHSIKHYNEHQ